MILLGILGWASTAPAAEAKVRGNLPFLTRTISYPDSAGSPVTRLELAFPLAGLASTSGSVEADSSTLHVLVIATAARGEARSPGSGRGATLATPRCGRPVGAAPTWIIWS